MKLKNLTNLADLNFKPVPKLKAHSKDRICFYYWILLSIPALIIFSSPNILKWVAVVLPMIFTGWNVPYSYSVGIQFTKIQRSATIQLLFATLFLVFQIVAEGFNIVKVLIQSVVIVTCYSIKNMTPPALPVDDSDEAQLDDKEQLDDMEVSKAFYKFDRLVNIVTVIIIGTISGITDFHYEPLALFSLAVLEYFARRFNTTVKYCVLFKMISALFALVAVTTKCLKHDFWSQVALLTSAWMFSLVISYNKVLLRLERPLSTTDYSFIRRNERILEFLSKSPNVIMILDRFWAFLVPIPLVIGFWSLSSITSSFTPPMLGILTTLATTLLIVQIHWIVARLAVIKLSQLMVISLLLAFLSYEAPSNDLRFLVFVQLGLFVMCHFADGIYGSVYELMRSGKHLKPRNTFYFPGMKIYAEALQRIWTSTSPIVSAFAISIMAINSIHGESRFILLTLSALAGIVSRTNFQLTWVLIEIYVIIEQVYLLFLSQDKFPAILNEVKFNAIIMNVLILLIAESQRLRAMPSIFSEEGTVNQSRIQDSSETSEAVEDENIAQKIPEDNEEEETPDYDNSLLWWTVSSLGRVTNVASLLFLMAVILFYPQFVDVTLQTSLYSLWAFLFTFLFYRSDVTSRLRFVFILILAILSCAFFLYDLLKAHDGRFNMPVHLFDGQKNSNSLLLHGMVFWFSCGTLLAMQLETTVNQKVEAGEEDINNNEEEEIDSSNSETATIKSVEDKSRLVSVKFVNEAGSFLERLFVVYWTRSCALLAFLAASFNPSIFGVIHLIIGCFLAWKNTLNPTLYVPMILWILCATFFPAVISTLSENQSLNVVLAGKIKSVNSTVCLIFWALTLFLQPVFIKSLKKLATETDRKYGLVSFQILPQDDSSLSQRNYESFENSTRYYVSNWFVEFHNEIMIAVLVMVSVSRINLYGIFSSILALLHIIVPILEKETALKALATVSFSIQMLCFILEYCLSLMFTSYFSGTSVKPELKSKYFIYVLNAIAGDKVKQNFFGLGSETASLITKSLFIGMNIILTVRWYLTSSYYEKEKPTRRFDSHWCRMCNQVSFKSMHAYSKAKHNIHLYFGWVSNAFLFITAISAHHQPTIPSIILLMFSLVFFFYGEASILMPNLRNQVYIVLGIILSWILFNSFSSTFALFGVTELSGPVRNILNFLGLTNIFKYLELEKNHPPVIFSSAGSRGILGFTIFLILLQIRLYQSKAWPFVLARLYHSYATSAKRAKLFHQNLQSVINFQQKNLDKAKEHFRTQIASAKTLDISDWKKLCYKPPESVDETDSVKGKELEQELPDYGTSFEDSEASKGETSDSTTEEEGGQTSLRNRSVNEIRKHLRKPSCDDLLKTHEEEQLDTTISPNPIRTGFNFNDRSFSSDSIIPSDETANKEVKEAESNFYLYTWLSMLRHIAKFIISSAQDYRRLQSRPSKKASMRILFHHQNNMDRFQFFMQMLFDLINANFDLVLDFLALEAQLYHSSGFSLVLLLAVLLISRVQRPYTNKKLHSRIIVLCAAWIIFNFCKVYFWNSIFAANQELTLKEIAQDKLREIVTYRQYGQSFFYRFLGFHKFGTIQDVTWRPTLILLALSYKRSLMRQLGLWDYGKGIQMARNFYQSEEDLDEIGEINVSENEEDSAHSENGEENDGRFSADSSDDESIGTDSILTDNSDIPMSTSWKELLWPSITMPWRDLYVFMFLSDFICLFLMIYYWSDFSLGHHNGAANSFIADMINQNMIPASLVNIVILATFVLVLDRALYVSKNRLGKVALQFSSLIGYHIYIFFYLTRFYQDPDISKMWGVKLWYFCKWIYWITSAVQLKYSYPPLRTEPFLGTEYGIFGANLHTIYRNIPFVDELKTIIDWSMTPSALGIWPWLKIADVYERLYAVQCARAFQGIYYGRHQFGTPFNQPSKIMQGVIFITVAVLVLWSPFLILSRSWMMTSNTVKSFKLEIGLENNGAPFMTFYQDKFTNDSSLDELKNFQYIEGVNPLDFDKSFFTKVNLSLGSQVPWRVTEMARIEAFKCLEKDDQQVNLMVKWTITRELSQSHPVIQGSNIVKLPDKEKKTLKTFLDTSNTAHMITVPIMNLIPTLIKAPIADNSKILDLADSPKKQFKLVKVCPKLNNVPVKTPWAKLRESVLRKNVSVSKRKATPPEFDQIQEECQFFLLSPEGKHPEIFIYSNKTPYYNLSSMNFTGLYFTIVLTASQLLKMMHADMTTRIQYDELPNPLPLLIMCQQILMMRELGDFANEEAIYWQLIEILRNPQILIEMTKL